MPRMGKAEYDRLVEEQYVCRIAFKGGTHPYIAPFLYVFDGKFIYFLSTKYGRKIEYFRDNPNVCVEIERYTPDLSSFSSLLSEERSSVWKLVGVKVEDILGLKGHRS